MKYMVFGYGNYNVHDEDIKGIESHEEALRLFKERITEWCEDNDENLEDTDYVEGDEYFEKGCDEKGIAIYTIYEVPEFTDDQTVEKLLWEAKLEIDKANFAAIDYMWNLTDSVVDLFTGSASALIDKALELITSKKE